MRAPRNSWNCCSAAARNERHRVHDAVLRCSGQESRIPRQRRQHTDGYPDLLRRQNQGNDVLHMRKNQVQRNHHSKSLSLPITGFKSLTQACEKYFRPELLTDYRCDMCGQLGTTTKVCEAVELPPTLMISLNRYQFNNQGQNKKVTSPLQFPKTLETRKFAPNLSGGHWQYELSAVMIHEGPNTDSGHYYDVIKDPVTGHWYTYNDKDVKEAKCPGVLVEKDAISRATPEMRGCYALIYRRIERDPALNIREPWLPPSSIVDPIRNRLSVEFSRDRNEGSQSVSLWTDVVKNRYKWISELWIGGRRWQRSA
ncbi:hypothetical protein L596_029345 [Steinernema carpocapsae]|uniref:ubiquitinyl hydrolase 1 n=1 Tax=Steinernema carpocapsae TaxID=34508 RepID=A0A4U5LUD4_STECR|nr:hypothetical protein L596_029345 [Steinernema carpocapsae]